MKTIYVRFLSAFFALAALAVAARGQAVDKLIVNIPHDFVAAGKTLPAGTYKVLRIDDNDIKQLALTSFENRDGVLLISSVVTPTREDKPALGFEHIGNQYFLSKIETADYIFTIPVSAKAATQISMSKQSGPSASGNLDNN
jgi:hypothetical protein